MVVLGKIGILFDQPWILAVMKGASLMVQPTSPKLGFFQTNVLGLARQYDQMAHQNNKEIALSTSNKKTARKIVIDLWNLFSCFCLSPCDIELVLPSLSVTLCKALQDTKYPELVVRIVHV